MKFSRDEMKLIHDVLLHYRDEGDPGREEACEKLADAILKALQSHENVDFEVTNVAIPSNVAEALQSESGSDRKAIAEYGLAAICAILEKNKDYGSSVFKSPELVPNMSAKDSILVRIGDKIGRLKKIVNQPAAVKSESFKDTLFDLLGYCLLYLCK